MSEKSNGQSMTKEFLKRAFIGMTLTVLIVITASLTYEYVVPVILSPDTISGISDGVNTGVTVLSSTKDKVMNVIDENGKNLQTYTDKASQDNTQLWYQNSTVEKSSKDTPTYPVSLDVSRDVSQDGIIPYSIAKGGKVTKIVDGDTLDIDGIRIRLALVNTPESGESGYAQATAFTRSHCPVGSTAMYDMDDNQKDGSYGRIIAKVWCFGYPVETPENSLNALLIDSGHAEILSRFCSTSEFSNDSWAKPFC